MIKAERRNQGWGGKRSNSGRPLFADLKRVRFHAKVDQSTVDIINKYREEFGLSQGVMLDKAMQAFEEAIEARRRNLSKKDQA